MDSVKGKIIKGIGGFYYVASGSNVYECRAKGAFRKEGLKPLVGDDCMIDVIDPDKNIGNVSEILPRKNSLFRPEVANVDMILIIFAVKDPDPSLNLLDRFLINLEKEKLPCVIAFNKEDIDTDSLGSEFVSVYGKAGYDARLISARTGEGFEELERILKGKTTALAGPSGAGKSSTINRLFGKEISETGEISKKISRGKNTTRHSELFMISEDTYICDTPGFTSFENRDVTEENLWTFYPEFAKFEKDCRFAGCSHVYENDCGIKSGVENGEIPRIRYENYCRIYEELASRKKY
ncbi:MAG: ribosome small subunit-dependent GTPase A [Lachnospiraceae bacterium]|nr:ribosome small subunit-dependent GTPase A [Lachnospiraceae bacterium]